jgi:hypothetical protein
MVNGIIFAGCSFTWGEGLELYSNLPTVDMEYYTTSGYHYPHVLEIENGVQPSHIEWMKANRFSRRVANHFNTFDCVWSENGGSYMSTMKSHITDNYNKYGEDISHIIIQCTEYLRDIPLRLDPKDNIGIRAVFDKKIRTELHRNDKERLSISDWESSKEGEIWKDEFGDKTAVEIDDLIFQKIVIGFFKWLIDFVKDKKVDVKIIGTWTNDAHRYDTLEEYDEEVSDFYNKNLIRLKHGGKSYRSMCELLYRQNGYQIFDDFPGTNNDHPSLKFHKFLTENIIDKIKRTI